MLHRHICPPVPRRHANSLTDFVDAIDGASLVTACHHEIVIHYINHERLPLPFHLAHVQLLLLHELVNEAALANGTHDELSIER